MRKSILVIRFTHWALALAFLNLGATVCQAQAKSGADIAALLGKHDEAMNQHNLNAILALFAPGPKTVILGTGAGERYQGSAEIKAAYTEYFKDFDKGTLTHNCYWKEGGGSGNLAWAAAQCKFSDSRGEKKREYELNVSAVVEKQGGTWYFVLLHFSNLTGGSAPSQ